jgi:hypothetical protein
MSRAVSVYINFGEKPWVLSINDDPIEKPDQEILTGLSNLFGWLI